MPRRKARIEGASQLKPVPIIGYPASEDLEAIVEAFKEAHPDEWAQIALCPTQHGLEAMIVALRKEP